MEQNQDNIIDKVLLQRFEEEIWNKVPHLENDKEGGKIVNATPLVDITTDFKKCAKEIYKIDLSSSELQVYGKLDSTLLTGSIKLRPAAKINKRGTGKKTGFVCQAAKPQQKAAKCGRRAYTSSPSAIMSAPGSSPRLKINPCQ